MYVIILRQYDANDELILYAQLNTSHDFISKFTI